MLMVMMFDVGGPKAHWESALVFAGRSLVLPWLGYVLFYQYGAWSQPIYSLDIFPMLPIAAINRGSRTNFCKWNFVKLVDLTSSVFIQTSLCCMSADKFAYIQWCIKSEFHSSLSILVYTVQSSVSGNWCSWLVCCSFADWGLCYHSQ